MLKLKRLLTTKVKDTSYTSSAQETLDVLKSLDFQEILHETFQGSKVTEHFYIFFNYQHSILVKFDTYSWGKSDGSWERAGKTVPPPALNGGTIYYNFRFNNTFSHDNCMTYDGMTYDGMTYEQWQILSSGHFIKTGKYDEHIWSGNHDLRNGIRKIINSFLPHGKFIKWIDCPMISLSHYGDYDRTLKLQDWNKKRLQRCEETLRRIKQFPVKVLSQTGLDAYIPILEEEIKRCKP